MGILPGSLPGYQSLAESRVRKSFEAVWDCSLSPNPGLTFGEILRAASKGKIKALYVVGANPALTEANAGHVGQALEKLEFLVVQDMFLSETAQLAHVVLPAASFAEKEGTFTNMERRVQRVRKAIEPIADSKPDWWIACQIAKKMGVQGFDYEHPSQIMEEVSRLTPSYGGVSYQRLENESLQWPCPTTDHPGTPILYIETFMRGKARFTPLEYRSAAGEPDEDYPLFLTTQRSLYEMGNLSAKVAGLNLLAGERVVEVNPKDASPLGLADSEPVRVMSRWGEVRAKAKLTEALPPGLVCMRPGSVESLSNAFDNSVMDPTAGIPGLKLCAVRLERIPDRT